MKTTYSTLRNRYRRGVLKGYYGLSPETFTSKTARFLGGLAGVCLKFGPGFVVGMTDGLGTPLDTKLKYSLLVAPQLLLPFVTYKFYKYVKRGTLENQYPLCLPTLAEITEERPATPLRRMANISDVVNDDKWVQKRVTRTAIKTPIATVVGYSLGYTLAQYIK